MRLPFSTAICRPPRLALPPQEGLAGRRMNPIRRNTQASRDGSAHRELLAADYIHEGFTGPVPTDLGARLLAGEMGKKDASEQTPRAP